MKDKEIKIKKINLKNYLIIDNIDKIYLVNNEIKQDYHINWKNNLFSTHCINIYIKYNIHLLTDEYGRNNKKDFRENKLNLIQPVNIQNVIWERQSTVSANLFSTQRLIAKSRVKSRQLRNEVEPGAAGIMGRSR